MAPARQLPTPHEARSRRCVPEAAASGHAPAPTQSATEPVSTVRRSAALDLVRLTPLMERASGRPEIMIGLLDGPVAINHPHLVSAYIRAVPGDAPAACIQADSLACMHGTFVAGILCAARGSPAPAICPGCTLLVRPIFREAPAGNGDMPSASADELAAAIIGTVDAGARVLNLSLALIQPASRGEHALGEALDYAGSRGVVTVVAAGNQAMVGSSAVTRHPWVISVAACDLEGRPLDQSNLGSSIGRRGLSAPGDRVPSLGSAGGPMSSGGTSVAAPFVTGAAALLWSEFPSATATEIRFALTQAATSRRRTIVPPVLDAWATYHYMERARTRR